MNKLKLALKSHKAAAKHFFNHVCVNRKSADMDKYIFERHMFLEKHIRTNRGVKIPKRGLK